MPLFDLGLRTTNVTSAQAAVEIIGSNTQRTKIYEIGFVLATAVATVLGLGRPQAVGITPAPVLFQAEEVSDLAAISACSLSWGTSPTTPLIFMRRFGGNAIGQGTVWVFPKGIVLSNTGILRSLVLWNITGGATLDVYIVGEE